ncbi:MAG TPA: glycosyltransferase family 39 protein [Rhizomicrobium sp.]|jgi:4-amino-4-deoxy-L-arabinose transferase-like glycosyltransferase|nr:glycosyltransferase family 39 protein [Rhizomicrobium sp.]
MADSKAAEKLKETAPDPVTAPALEAAPPPRWLTVVGRHPFALLALLGLLLWLPGMLSLPALDRDESRFAQSSRQMVDSGNWVDIRFGQVPRYKKPVGIYWLQAGATELAGLVTGRDDQIWTYRLPSLLGGIAAAWLTVWCALAVTEAEAALLAGLLMLGSVLLTAESTIATTDAVLLACALGMQGVLLRLYRAARDDDAPKPSGRLVLWGWAAAAFGILVKFPVVPGIGIATMIGLVAWDRKWDWLRGVRPMRGLVLTFLLVSPWLIAIAIQSQGAFFQQSLGNDFASKIAGGQESHGAWPGYYLLLSAACFWPSILFVLPGVALGLARRAEPGIRFLLVWAASWWLIVEAVPTKLPHYVIGAYPPLAILAAMFVLDPRPVKWLAAARWIGVVQFGTGAVLFTAAILLAPHYFGNGIGWPVLAAAGAGAVLALAALILAALRKPLTALLLGLAAIFVFAPGLTVLVAPRLEQLWISERLKAIVAAAGRPGDPSPAIAGYQEPSLVFALGADVVLANGAGAAEAGAHSGGLALIEDSERGAFLARLAELQADAKPVGDLSGFNYSRGRKQHVTVYRVAQLHELN